jgi:hypothetical protein
MNVKENSMHNHSSVIGKNLWKILLKENHSRKIQMKDQASAKRDISQWKFESIDIHEFEPVALS